MFRRKRIQQAHIEFLEQCRSLRESQAYWNQRGGWLRRVVEAVVPVPLLGLSQEGSKILAALEHLEAVAIKEKLTEAAILHYHRSLFDESSQRGGKYRETPLEMGNENPLRPAKPSLIPQLMTRLDHDMRVSQERIENEKPTQERVVHLAVEVYYRIGTIHPFRDGNGRVARLAMNHILRRYGVGYIILPSLDSSREFWEALKAARLDELTALSRLSVRYLHSV